MKRLKVLYFLIVAFLFLTINNNVYAVLNEAIADPKPKQETPEIIEKYEISPTKFKESYTPGSKGRSKEINEVAGRILGWIFIITAASSVVIIAILGLKFMFGSLEQRAEYKKSFVPLVVGMFIVVCSSGIMNVVWKSDEFTKVKCKEHEYKCKSGYGVHVCIKCGQEEPHCWPTIVLSGVDPVCDKCGAKYSREGKESIY